MSKTMHISFLALSDDPVTIAPIAPNYRTMFAEQMSSDYPQVKDVIYLDSAGTPVRVSEVGETSSFIPQSGHADYR